MSFAPNLRHLAALIEIDRCGSINKAAEAIHLSQSALTQGISKIESELGVTLFDRSATGMYANEAGRAFMARVERAIQHFQSFDDDLNAERRKTLLPARHLHLAATNTQLRAIIAVVEHKNISLAAAALGLAQPTVQRSVREVEEICGETLFIRSAAGVDPTYTARRLARFASLGFAEIQAGMDDVHQVAGKMTGKLTIGALPLARTEIVPEAVTAILERYPDLQVSIIDGPYDELVHGLTHGRIHLIIGALRQPKPMRDLEQEVLFSDQLSVIARNDHPLATGRPVRLADLAEQDWVAPRTGTPARERFQLIFDTNQLPQPTHIIECSSSVAVRGLLLKSDRVALFSRRQMLPDIEAGLLTTLPIALAATERPIGITTRKTWKPTLAQDNFLAVLRNITAESVCANL